jgi:hypothetical protein
MVSPVEAARLSTLQLLDETRRATRSYLSGLDPERLVHNDDRSWRVRDVVGHLGVWNGEAAHSLQAFLEGREYFCLPSEEEYDSYNGPAAQARRTWRMEQVWAEYEAAHDELRLLIERLPDDKWHAEMLFPWNERGTAEYLIEVMMTHETTDHCAVIHKALG